jgi:oxygen-independent coproporphyrinogen III oxidase
MPALCCLPCEGVISQIFTGPPPPIKIPLSGLYIHIPFCRKACTYCDFHFSTSTGSMERVLDAMERELEQRAHEVPDRSLGTIYFGGGTPSLIPLHRIGRLINLARQLFTVAPDAEITLEANPDDISPEKLAQWKDLGINRLSLGTQSFREERLRFMGRAHSAEQALRSIEAIARADYHSWTIDLIYGLPGMTLQEWDEQLTIALDHGMPHLSAYCLTVEPRTALAHQVGRALVTMPGDDAQSEQFDLLIDRMETAGLDHYEISNFGLPGHHSRHNTSYWEGIPYLGIGPSAHSYDRHSRRWNVSNNLRYASAIEGGGPYWESETLTAAQRTNETLLTGLRTRSGVQLDLLEHDPIAGNALAFKRHMENGHLHLQDGRLALTRSGRHFADRIAADLFVNE